MLDDLKYIHERDAQDALGIAEKQWQQLEHEFKIEPDLKTNEIDNVVYAGMGGSALAALLIYTWPKLTVPFEIVRDYNLPNYVGSKTLVVIASYSGNTEETLSALAEAEAKDAQIVVIAGGGKLSDIAGNKNYPLAVLPKAAQPRYAIFYNFKALLTILGKAGLAKTDELDSVGQYLQEAIKTWLPVIPASKNPAKQLAQEIMGKTPIIYAGPLMFPAAYKWKISFNENAKNVAWCSQIPEFNHNEFVGWTSHPIDKPYAVIDLRSNLEHERVQKRFEVSERLLSGMRPAAHVINVQGDTPLEQLLWAVAFGDFVTLYLAILNGVNPTPVQLVEKFKKELG